MKITALETLIPGPASGLPALVFVRVHTDEGLTGIGETFYMPHTVAVAIHEYVAPLLLGRNPLLIEKYWNDLYEPLLKFGGIGAEMRALAAVDVALWDLLGQVAGLPIHQLLGGAVWDRIPVYNTCAGPSYGSVAKLVPGAGSAAITGQWDDLASARLRPGELAEELLADGFRAMKIWPFDEIAIAGDRRRISSKQLSEGLEPVEKIRAAVGLDIDVMIEGHGFWALSPAIRIARALEPLQPAWLEDLTTAHDPAVQRRIKESTSLPLAVSEYLIGRGQYKTFLEAEAVDVVMVDPTWSGGITESRKVAVLADSFTRTVAMHDCTGPLTLLAGLHIAATSPNLLYQEVVRALVRTVYRDLITELPDISDGYMSLPMRPGIGTSLQPGLEIREGVMVQTSSVT